MPSNSLQNWNTTRVSELNEIRSAHQRIGGGRRGRRYATQQINHAYTMLLSSQFQGFCRDLHSEAVDHIVRSVAPAAVQSVLRAEFTLHRKLDRGNPNPGNIGSDFNRLGLRSDPRPARRAIRHIMVRRLEIPKIPGLRSVSMEHHRPGIRPQAKTEVIRKREPHDSADRSEPRRFPCRTIHSRAEGTNLRAEEQL